MAGHPKPGGCWGGCRAPGGTILYIYIYIYLFLLVYCYLYIYICIYTYMYIYVYTYTHTHMYICVIYYDIIYTPYTIQNISHDVPIKYGEALGFPAGKRGPGRPWSLTRQAISLGAVSQTKPLSMLMTSLGITRPNILIKWGNLIIQWGNYTTPMTSFGDLYFTIRMWRYIRGYIIL